MRANAIAEYNGQIFLAGNMDANDEIKEICRWDGIRWTDVGGGIGGGGAANVWRLKVWQGHLYVLGQFNEWNAGRGNGITRWNGTHWQRLGDALYPVANISVGTEVCEWGGGLVVAGQFSKADGIPARRIALWDGVRWCGFGNDSSTFNNNFTGVVSFRDTLYLAGGFWEFNGVPMPNPYLVRWVGGTTLDTCSPPVVITTLGVDDGVYDSTTAYTLSPNPFTTTLSVRRTVDLAAPITYTLTDAGGRVVHHSFSSTIDYLIPLAHLLPGLYMLRITDATGAVRYEKVVKQ